RAGPAPAGSRAPRLHDVRAGRDRATAAASDAWGAGRPAAPAELQERRPPRRHRGSRRALPRHGRAVVFVVDTNILVYAADEESPLHGACREMIATARGRAAAWYLTWSICYEFMRVTTHPRVFRRPWPLAQAWSFVSALLSSPSLGVLVPTERH